MRHLSTPLAFFCALSISGCDQKPPEPMPDKPSTPAATGEAPAATGSPETQPTRSDAPGQIQWRKPDAWEDVNNPSPMRKATYKIPRAEGDSDDGELSVTTAGGSVEANVERWVGQFEEKPEAKSTAKEVGGVKVTIAEMSGTFKGGGPMMGGSGEPKKDWMMLAAIVHSEPQMYFFKLTGPKKTVEAARGDFDVLVGSITK
jgi:hypothetical protein